MTGLIKGNDVLFLVDKGDGFKPFVCAKDLSIETTASLVPVTTVGDGVWDKFKYSSLSYSVNVTGVIRFSDTDISAFDIMDHQTNFLPLQVKIIFVDQEDNNQKIFKGLLMVERSNVSGNASAFALSDFTLRGTGKPLVTSCDSSIGLITVEIIDANTVKVHLFDVTGSPASFNYQFDNEIEQNTLLTDFNILHVSGGNHSVIVTPICESGGRGEPYTADFATEIPTTGPSCGVPTGVNVTEVTTTSFKVNWVYGSGNTSVNLSVKNTLTGAVQDYPNQTGTSKTFTGQSPNTVYEISVQGYCGPGSVSSISVLQIVTSAGAIVPRYIVRNGSDAITVSTVTRNGILIFPMSVEPHASYAVDKTVHTGDFTFNYNNAGGNGSIRIITTYQDICQPLLSGSNLIVFTGITAAPGDVEIYINPYLCP